MPKLKSKHRDLSLFEIVLPAGWNLDSSALSGAEADKTRLKTASCSGLMIPKISKHPEDEANVPASLRTLGQAQRTKLMRSIGAPFEEWQLLVADAAAMVSRCSCRTKLSVLWIGEGCRHSLPVLAGTAKRVVDRASPPSQIHYPIPADTTTK
jgi:hypothetical protein